MKILVLNGSPKGKYSITLQTTRYLEKIYPDHSFEVLHVGQKTKSLSNDFTPAREAIERADVLLFSYPVYTFIAPCQLHLFIELLKKEKMDLSGKYATQITTSKHFGIGSGAYRGIFKAVVLHAPAKELEKVSGLFLAFIGE